MAAAPLKLATEAEVVFDTEWAIGTILETVGERVTVEEREAGGGRVTAGDGKASDAGRVSGGGRVTGGGWATGGWAWIPVSWLSSSAPPAAVSQE